MAVFINTKDELQIACAVLSGAAIIVTNNMQDFAKSIIPSMSSDQFVSTYSVK